MLNADVYIDSLTSLLKEAFGPRLAYVGLQGSYLRGEATENSDIDIVVILDKLTVSDLERYRKIIKSAGHYEKSCGFICSTADMAAWNPLEICNLLHATKDYYGSLWKLVPKYSREDIRNFAKLSLNNLYHEICHRYIHAAKERNAANLQASYKSVFFILQTVEFLRTGAFVQTKREMLNRVSGMDKKVMEFSLAYPDDGNFAEAFELLLVWCQETLVSL